MKTLFMGTLSEYETTIELLSPDAEMRDAAMEVKKLVDALLQQAKDSIMKRVVPGSLRSCCWAVDPPNPSPAFVGPFWGPFSNPERRITMQCLWGSRHSHLTFH